MTDPNTSSTIDRVTAWICWFASSQGTALTSIQLVKYLYLADLYHARRSSGTTLTRWPWSFVHFGPYCSEAIQTIERVSAAGAIQAQHYESRYAEDKEFKIYRGGGEEPAGIDSILSIAERSDLKRVIKKWAGDTAGLLDYVYFDTEPMAHIQPRDRLDFSKARLPEPRAAQRASPLAVPERKKRKARDAIAQLKARTVMPGAPSAEDKVRDAAYAHVLAAFLDREDPPSASGEFDVTKLIAMALDDS